MPQFFVVVGRSKEQVATDSEVSAVDVWSRVFSNEGLRVNDKLQLYADTNEADQEGFDVHVIGPC